MRGQINQLFIFLAAMLVIVATIVLGMRLLGSFTDTACEAGRAQFTGDLRTLLDTNRVLGSRDSDASVRAPCDATRVCFVDAGWRERDASQFTSDDPTITTAVRAGSDANVFLVLDDGTHDAGFDERIILRAPAEEPSDGAACVDVSRGRFTFTTEGYGRYVRISP